MANLLIGIGGLGTNILRHIHKHHMLKTLPENTELLLIDDEGKSSDYPFPAVITLRGLRVVESNTAISTKDDLLH